MVRLLTVIGHGTNMLPHFINHYEKYVDEINIVVYESDIEPMILDKVKDIIKDFDNVKIIHTIKDRVYDFEKVTMLYNFNKSKHLNDWWVIADIDEFHLYPNDSLNDLINECDDNGWDLVRGGFIDRVGRGGEFSELVDDVSIWEQFPNAGFFRYPMSQACPNKICVMKGYIEITNGQHYAKINEQTTWRWQGWNHPLINPNSTVQVHHFKWDKTVIDRIKEVINVKKDYSYSDEYALMFKSLLKTKFKINLENPDFMFELGLKYPEYGRYRGWKLLINKIKSI
jgi:hypothetical protein